MTSKTSNQRRRDVITSHLRRYDVVSRLCACWVLTSTNTTPYMLGGWGKWLPRSTKLLMALLIAPEYNKDLLINIKKSNYNFRRENQASLPAVKSTRYGLRSFCYGAARIWNSLPNDLRLAESFPQFKRLLHAWDGDICGCPSCLI